MCTFFICIDEYESDNGDYHMIELNQFYKSVFLNERFFLNSLAKVSEYNVHIASTLIDFTMKTL